MNPRTMELSIVMPCRNEEQTLEFCILEAKRFLQEQDIRGEIVIGDNGSTDASREIALRHGCVVIAVEEKGYGCAIRGAVPKCQGQFVIMGDCDASYDFYHLTEFLARLRQGFELVVGNRFQGGIQPGAMPWKNRYIGNPVLSGLGRLLYRTNVRDFHCGLRGFSREAFERMRLSSPGMELASEMVVKASLLKMRETEVPTILRPDGRSHASHLRPWRDGLRHLNVLLSNFFLKPASGTRPLRISRW
jgi:glycosyltransferase involved in cell wall biosynthesis